MGGFMAYKGNEPIQVLLPDELRSYSLTGNGDFPRISKAEIKDKSKGDFISKAVVILQTGWFVIQCAARRFQGLQTTELELVTVAFATINFFIYVLWFEKPLDVQCGVRVYKRRKSEQSTDPDPDDGAVEAGVGFWVALCHSLSKLPSAIANGPLVTVLGSQSLWPYRVLIWPFIKTQQILGLKLSDQGTANSKMKVATFYPETWPGNDQLPSSLALFAATVMAVIFGGIHCIGSSFVFPSFAEQTLWRVASASIAGIPIVLFLWLQALLLFKREYPGHGVIRGFLHSILCLQVCAYILCRLALLVLPFLCLRSVPPTAYYVVHWALIIPHI
jgi:hypothetical protein